MIIGLIGFKQVGKSTAAQYLQDTHGFVRVNMKDALIAELKQNFPDLIEAFGKIYDGNPMHYDGMKPWTAERLFAEKPLGFRELMQNYGTQVRRGDRESYWTDQWRKAVYHKNGVNVVTDDVRFLNEAEAVRSEGGILIRLVRPDLPTGGTHVSETEQLEIIADYTIEVNKGEHNLLYLQLDRIIALL